MEYMDKIVEVGEVEDMMTKHTTSFQNGWQAHMLERNFRDKMNGIKI
jgi:hypothetical protein